MNKIGNRAHHVIENIRHKFISEADTEGNVCHCILKHFIIPRDIVITVKPAYTLTVNDTGAEPTVRPG